MGINDFQKKVFGGTKSAYEEGKDELKRRYGIDKFVNGTDELKRRYELEKYLHVKLKCKSEHAGVLRKTIIMFQKPTGEVFFDYDDENLFYLIDYNWGGSRHKTITRTHGAEDHVTKGKSGRAALGAAVGSFAAPGVGTVVGMGLGALGKKKKHVEKQQVSKTSNKELTTPAALKFRNLKTNEIFSIQVLCSTEIDSKINCFYMMDIPSSEDRDVERTDVGVDPIEQVKKLKELLDIGAITEEEFELKKKELLNFI